MTGTGTTLVGRAISYLRTEGIVPTLRLASIYGPSFLYYRRFGTRRYNPGGYDLFAADWDNFIILDACRHDVFVETTSLPGETTAKPSRASATSEFVRANFSDTQAHDTVYVAGNSWFLRLRDEVDGEVHQLYDIGDNSDRKKEERTVSCVKHCLSEHPEKRLLIHLIPPHHPFIGPTASRHLPTYEEQIERPLFDRIRRGDVNISDEILRRVYAENLERAIPAVEEMLSILPGKTIVSADHGEMLGERLSPLPVKFYGHVEGLYTDELVTVPWHVHRNGDRKEITAAPPRREPRTEFAPSSKEVDQRLRELGYKV